MTRKKVKLAFIANDSARKATYKKRKKGLMKKVSELSTLCGIDACAIIYSPCESQPEVWPSTLGVQRVVAQFKRMPEMEQSKKMVNQESFIRQRISKAGEQLKKQRKDNREKEMTEVMYECLTGGRGVQSLPMADLSDVGWLVDQNMKEIGKRMESLKKMTVGPASTPANHAAGSTVGGEVEREQKPPVTASGVDDFDVTGSGQQRTQWFGEWMNSNPSEHMGFCGDEMMMMPSFGDNGHGALWSCAFFP